MKVSKYRKSGDLTLKTVALIKLKTENLTKILLEFCVGGALMPFQPRSHANSCTFIFITTEYFLFLKTSLVPPYPHIFGTY